jgi:hypothetical protein
MVLTDTAIRKSKPREKPYKVSDSQGLYLLVNPGGMPGIERQVVSLHEPRELTKQH